MKSEAMIKTEGMRTLPQVLGLVDAEKFIMLMKREPFDYTELQSALWADKSVDQVFDAARDFESNQSIS